MLFLISLFLLVLILVLIIGALAWAATKIYELQAVGRDRSQPSSFVEMKDEGGTIDRDQEETV